MRQLHHQSYVTLFFFTITQFIGMPVPGRGQDDTLKIRI